jgi:hypothetical protein
MKTFLLNSALILSNVLMVAPSFAHDPAEHAKTAETPDCDAMKKMDHSKMDMNDPVMQALMKKCSAAPAEKKEGEQHQGMDHGDMKGMDDQKVSSSESHEGHGSH